MLEDIVNSSSESAVLSFFLVAPQRSFSVFEVSRRLHMSKSKTALVLNRLSQAGPLLGFSKKAKRYYIINQKYKLLPPIKEFLLKNGPKYTDELFLAITRLGEIKAAFLSGIFAGYSNLPVDLLLVGKVNLRKLDEFLKSAQKLMGQEINYSIMTVEEFELRRDTFDRFIRDIFDYRHLVVVDKLAKRKK